MAFGVLNHLLHILHILNCQQPQFLGKYSLKLARGNWDLGNTSILNHFGNARVETVRGFGRGEGGTKRNAGQCGVPAGNVPEFDLIGTVRSVGLPLELGTVQRDNVRFQSSSNLANAEHGASYVVTQIT
jgi:hypothetical protein